MAEKTVVQWQNSYSVGIKMIDEQHARLIDLTNKLFASCLAGQGRAGQIFMDTIHETVEYVGYHFGSEEKLMSRINYPRAKEHTVQHQDFAREVFRKVEECKFGKVFTPLSFVYYLRDWILHHIAICDKQVGEYLMKLKKSGELEKLTLQAGENTVMDSI